MLFVDYLAGGQPGWVDVRPEVVWERPVKHRGTLRLWGEIVTDCGRFSRWQDGNIRYSAWAGNPLRIVTGQNMKPELPTRRLVGAWEKKAAAEVFVARPEFRCNLTRVDVAANIVLPEDVWDSTLDALRLAPKSLLNVNYPEYVRLACRDGSFVMYKKGSFIRVECRAMTRPLRKVGVVNVIDLTQESLGKIARSVMGYCNVPFVLTDRLPLPIKPQATALFRASGVADFWWKYDLDPFHRDLRLS